VPKNGDRLSVLGFGCMRLAMKGSVVDEERAIKQIRFAIDNGVNYVDTAPPYHGGESERILGNALQDGYREKVKVATKLTPFFLSKPEDMEMMLSVQLKKLQTDHIDYYLLHGMEAEFWKKMQSFGALKFLNKAKKEGKIVNLGFSFHGSLGTFKEIVDAEDWAMCQIQYNLLDEKLQAGTGGLKYAASKKLAVMVMEPLRGGTLAANLPAEVQQIYDNSGMKRSPVEWALRWVWNHPQVTLALSGMNDESQVQENMKITDTALPNSMSPDELKVISQAVAAFRRLQKVPCTGCQYCLPCPMGVDIPSHFQIYNEYHLYKNAQQARGAYAMMLLGGLNGERADATLCKNCGQCIECCPQHISIPDRLKEVEKDLGGPKTQAMVNAMRARMAQS